jgi:hypothetical protein
MFFKIDTADRKAYEAAIAAIVRHGSLKQALSHYGSKDDKGKSLAERKRRQTNRSLARLLVAESKS